MKSSAFILLILVSSALSKSTVKHEPRESTKTESPSRSSPTASSPRNYRKRLGRKNDTEPVETLFIPEDPNRYAETLSYVRTLLGARDELGRELSSNVDAVGNEKHRGTTQGEFEDEKRRGDAKNTSREEAPARVSSKNSENKFLKAQDPLEAERYSRPPENEEKYPARNLGGASSSTALGNAGDIEEISMGSHQQNFDRRKTEPDEDDLIEAANFGLEAMRNLYSVMEPALYSMGLYLDSDNPARYVATFNDQTEEARTLAQYGFAVLQGTTMFKKKFPNASTDSLASGRSQSNPLRRHCPNRGVPSCPPASLRYRTSDGSCNNLEKLWWGSAMSAMQRFLPPVYEDGVQSIRRSASGKALPSARLVTSVIHEDRDIPLASVTHMLMQWGQFVDHDLTATGQSRGFNGTAPQCCLNLGTGFQPPEFMHPECLPIAVGERDSFFGPLGVKCLEFVRSGSAPSEDCKFGPREQLSQVTSYLDASMVYSSNAFHADTLRLFRNGLLQYGNLQPRSSLLAEQDFDLCRRGSLSTNCFRAGDGRLGEQPALTSLHIVFLRLHNKIATKLAALNPHWSDEKLFQESRRIVGAVIQHITYREFLPIVLGQDVMKIFDLQLLKKGYYEGYDPTVNPNVANGFSTAAYRFGHSLVQRSLVRFDSNHSPIFNNVSIHKEFSNPVNLETAGSVDRLLLGLINQPSQRRDEYITVELTNHLFQTPSFPFGMDLASINIQRGRDHGLPPYVQWREPCGLSPIRSFEDLERVIPSPTAKRFRLVYSSVEDIDLFPAGIAEKSVKGGLVGPTFACIIGQQFSNLRRGDRFWYENPGRENSFTGGQLQQIRRVSLAQVLCITIESIETIQPFVFLTQDTLRNQRLPCKDLIAEQLNLEFWAEKPTEFRSRTGFLNILKRQPQTTTSKPIVQGTTETVEQLKLFPQKAKPSKASIHQENKIIVKRPLGPSDNVTVVVHNNAVNSPVFISDSVYGSNVGTNPSNQQLTQEINSPRPILDVNKPQQNLQSVPAFVKPVPTLPPSLPNVLTGYPYVPYAFNDPNNPNPLSQGFQSNYGLNDVVFESYPGTTPRPTLYTYYKNFQRPSTQRPHQDVNAYFANQRPNPWPTQYQQAEQLSSKPLYDTSGNQLHNSNRYEPANWHKWPQDLINQLNDPGHWNPQSYRHRPSSSYTRDPAANWNYQNDRYGPDDRPLTETNPSVESFYQTRTPDNDRYHSIRPLYQHPASSRPVQADSDSWSNIPTYQVQSDRPDINRSPGYQSESLPASIIYQESVVGSDNSLAKSSEKLTSRNESKTANYQSRPDTDSTDRLMQDGLKRNQSVGVASESYRDRADISVDGSYQEHTQPVKIQSVTIVTEAAESVNQAGHKVDRTENVATREIPKPLGSQVINRQVVRRPGQYYYEKNVLHRYPDKIDDRASIERSQSIGDAEQRRKTVVDDESTDRPVIEGSARIADGNDTSVEESRHESSDSVRDDDVVRDLDEAFLGEIESVTSTDRTSSWLNPEEDSCLPSALELPEMPSDKATDANELPRPIKCRRHAS